MNHVLIKNKITYLSILTRQLIMKITINKYGYQLCALISVIGLTSCGNITKEAKYPTGHDRNISENIYEEQQGIFGKDGLRLLGKSDAGNNGNNLGVNAYLWRASLDTISFMPLASADPFGGTILTDWYSSPDTPNERSKINLFILDKQLRADGIKVKTFRQTFENGRWIDAKINTQTNIKLEDTILTRARQLRSDRAFGK